MRGAINAERLFPGESDSSQPGSQSALREIRLLDSETASAPGGGTMKYGNCFSLAQDAAAGESGGVKIMNKTQRAGHSKQEAHAPLIKEQADSTQENRAESPLAGAQISEIGLADSAGSSVQTCKHSTRVFPPIMGDLDSIPSSSTT